jgi:hypothetical protein
MFVSQMLVGERMTEESSLSASTGVITGQADHSPHIAPECPFHPSSLAESEDCAEEFDGHLLQLSLFTKFPSYSPCYPMPY